MEEIERLFTEGVTAAGERAKGADVTRMNEEKVQDSGEKKLSSEAVDSRTFTYKELVAKGDLQGIVIDKNQQVPLLADGNIDIQAVLKTVRSKCKVDLDILGNLYAINAKKVGRQGHNGITKVITHSGTATTYAYSIAHFLDDVKEVFKNTFSNDVYKTLGVQREQDDISTGLMYSVDDNDTDYSLEDTAEAPETAPDTNVGDKGYLTRGEPYGTAITGSSFRPTGAERGFFCTNFPKPLAI